MVAEGTALPGPPTEEQKGSPHSIHREWLPEPNARKRVMFAAWNSLRMNMAAGFSYLLGCLLTVYCFGAFSTEQLLYEG